MCSLGQQLRANIDAAIDGVIDGIGAFGHKLRQALPGLARDAAVELALAAVPVVGEVRAGRRVVAVAEAGGKFLSENRHIRGINAARKDFSRIGATSDDVVNAIAQRSGWEAVARGAMAGGQMRVGTGTVRYSLKNLGRETVFNAWIP
jgi:hypothetical protein